MRDAGYYALEALRIEKGYRAWSRELTPDINPIEAGLGFAVALDKPGGFIGRDALMAAKQAGIPRRRIVQFTLDETEPVLWGGELILRDGKAVGEVRSAAYGHTLGRSVALGLVEAENGVDKDFIQSGRFQIDLAGRLHPATAHLKSPYDPKSERVRADIAEARAAAA